MNVTLVNSETLQEILRKLEALEKAQLDSGTQPEKQWVDNQYLCKLLDVHKRTLQNYRDSGKLPYSQPEEGGKVYYKLSDVNAFLEAYYKPKFHIPKRKRS